MKRIYYCVSTVLLAAIFSSCDLMGTGKEETDPTKTLGKSGNYWSVSAPGHGASQITIESNDDGNVVASIPYGGKTILVEGKITSNGIYDYVYSNGDKKKPFALVKFDAKVGDKWEYKVGNQTVVRKVVHKSTEDDTFYGFLMIKTIDVEETIPAGVTVNGKVVQASKILWRFNHKFGFISADVTETNNKTTRVSSNYTNASE